MGRKKKTEQQDQQPEIHKELKGFSIHINEFGEIVSTLSVDKLNDFLDEKVDDKKLRERKKEDEDPQ